MWEQEVLRAGGEGEVSPDNLEFVLVNEAPVPGKPSVRELSHRGRPVNNLIKHLSHHIVYYDFS